MFRRRARGLKNNKTRTEKERQMPLFLFLRSFHSQAGTGISALCPAPAAAADGCTENASFFSAVPFAAGAKLTLTTPPLVSSSDKSLLAKGTAS